MQGPHTNSLSKKRTFFDLAPGLSGCDTVVAQADAGAAKNVLIIALLEDFGQT